MARINYILTYVKTENTYFEYFIILQFFNHSVSHVPQKKRLVLSRYCIFVSDFCAGLVAQNVATKLVCSSYYSSRLWFEENNAVISLYGSKMSSLCLLIMKQLF